MARIVYNSQELARVLEVSDPTIMRWRKEGMPYFQIGLKYRYELDSVLKWLKKKTPKHFALAARVGEKNG